MIPTAVPHGTLVLAGVTPAGVHHHPVGPQLGGQTNGVGEVAEGVFQQLRLLRGVLILVGDAGGGDRHHPDIVIQKLLFQSGDVAGALVVQPEVGGAAPKLDLADAQPLLTVQKIVQREAAVVLVHVHQLAAEDAHYASTSFTAATAFSSG